ncbi:GEMIN2 (predicted) [Pycnogonum litorale]
MQMYISEDESSSDGEHRRQGLAVKAFHVEKGIKNYDISSPPTNGNEYLLRVQQEAKICPKVVVAKFDTSKFLNSQTVKVSNSTGCSPAPRGYAPNLDWQKRQVADFSVLRMKIAAHKARNKQKEEFSCPVKLPQIDDQVGWCKLCFGHNSKHDSSTSDQIADLMQPLLSIVTNMSQALIEAILQYHIVWMESHGFSSNQGCWFFALLAALEKPLTPEACSSLRSLVRCCSSLRASLPDADDPKLTPLSLVICLVARYFDQTDLADEPDDG